MAKQKGKKNNNSSPNKARARAKSEIEARQAAKKAAKKAELKARGIDPDRKKVHRRKHRKAVPSYNGSVTANSDIVYVIRPDGKIAVDDSNVIYDEVGWHCEGEV